MLTLVLEVEVVSGRAVVVEVEVEKLVLELVEEVDVD